MDRPSESAEAALRPGQSSLAPSAVALRADEASTFARLAIIRLPLILLVVCYHNESGGAYVAALQATPVLQYIVNLVANGLGGIRVPVFFLIAGYVFFRNLQPGPAWFRSKIASRVGSVLLPLILWSLLWMAIISVAQRLPWTADFFNGRSTWSVPIAHTDPWRLVLAVVGRNHELFLYHLWFLRDLFVLVLLTPVFLQAVRWCGGWAVFAMTIVWMLDLDNGLVSKDAMFFFFMGCHLAISRRPIFCADALGPWAIGCWIILKTVGGDLSMPETKTWIACGTIGTLYLSGLIEKLPAASQALRSASRYSFFIFVAHEPLLTGVRRLYGEFMPPVGSVAWFVAYFAVVAITAGLLVVAFRVGELLSPRVLDLMTGGRASP